LEQWLIDTVENIQSSTDLANIKSVLMDIREQLDCGYVTYVIKIPNGFTRSTSLFVSDYPTEWVARYAEKGYINIDPVAQHCFNYQEPYSWCHFNKQHDKEVQNFFSEAYEFSISNGVGIGMPRFTGESGLIQHRH